MTLLRSFPRLSRFLDRFPDFPRVKSILWPVIFWSWVAGVSLWIDAIAVEDIPVFTPGNKFSRIVFHEFSFDQTNADQSGVLLSAPRAFYDSEKGTLSIEQPQIQWKEPARGVVFSATADTGEFKARTGDSALPAAFQYLDLRGHAGAVFQTNRVDSGRMLFDNENHLFLFPETFVFKGEKVNSRLKQMYYNPFNQKLDSISKAPKINPALKKALSDEVQTKP